MTILQFKIPEDSLNSGMKPDRNHLYLLRLEKNLYSSWNFMGMSTRITVGRIFVLSLALFPGKSRKSLEKARYNR